MVTTYKQAFEVACDEARFRSLDGCTYHVNAHCTVMAGEPIFASFNVSDWYVDGATLRTYTNGVMRE